MAAYHDQIRRYIDLYRKEVPNDGVVEAHEVAAWAYKKGLHKPNLTTIVSLIARDISQAMREEYRTDRQGRRYRAKHAATQKSDGKTLSLWADIDDPNAPHMHFVKSFAQRRLQIVGDCFQLKTDVDVYNDRRRPDVAVQVLLDFTVDVEEAEHLKSSKAA
jgi:hypothetical protein